MTFSIRPNAANLNEGLQIADARASRIIAIMFASLAFTPTPAEALEKASQELAPDNLQELLYAASVLPIVTDTWNKLPSVLRTILKIKGYEALRDANELTDAAVNAFSTMRPRPRPDGSTGGVRVEVTSIAGGLGDILESMMGDRKKQAESGCQCPNCQLYRAVHGLGADADVRHRSM